MLLSDMGFANKTIGSSGKFLLIFYSGFITYIPSI